ncbi:arylsulfatase [Allorhodopirellula solitaria]|uniref:Arylsulfatase n=1 Tax=Allorhodopirellula solitaria TaxID=2527987 RepID=A0A5C5XX96_9BACT|nr:arylsulfatase [Allorhodopirellula solitaria]TWT67159.1 Arylsulfatase [Allorhodopirellula solitaria]
MLHPRFRCTLFVAFLAFTATLAATTSIVAAEAKPPNIIFIMVDDMGYHDLGCYGSQTIQTPNIDRLAAEGIRFTDCYSGDTVCASARSTLMTGTHKGHTPVRGNSGGIPLYPADVTVAEVLKQASYRIGGFGKWGLGNQGHDGAAERQGFDQFFGYYNQWHAHTYYTHLFRNSERVDLNGRYTHHAIFDETMRFLKESHDEPFFLYCPWTPPHAAYEIPADEPAWAMYKDKPWDHAAKVVAAMDSMMDRQVGEMMAVLKEQNIDDETIFFFTSDNGAAKRFGGIHNSCGEMQGHKRSLHEGGIRVPMIARWPGKISAGTVSEQPWYFPDVMPTLAELAGVADEVPDHVDGISVVPTLLGTGKQQQHEYMFWQFGNERAVRSGNWKGLTQGDSFTLYDLSQDIGEQKDLSQQHPEISKRLQAYGDAAYMEPRSQKDDGKYTGQSADHEEAQQKKKKAKKAAKNKKN